MTPNKEDYLKCIYEIGAQHEKISNKEIAARMQVSPPAVTEMVKRMISSRISSTAICSPSSASKRFPIFFASTA